MITSFKFGRVGCGTRVFYTNAKELRTRYPSSINIKAANEAIANLNASIGSDKFEKIVKWESPDIGRLFGLYKDVLVGTQMPANQTLNE